MKTLITLALLALPLVSNEEESAHAHPFETDAQRVPALSTSGNALIRGATVHSAVEPPRRADVLVTDGRIAAIGGGLEAPEGALVLEAEGLHLAPGVVDTHSHMAIERGINEGTLSITADCDISDVINADDLTAVQRPGGRRDDDPVPARLRQRDRRPQRGDQAQAGSARADELRFPERAPGHQVRPGGEPQALELGRRRQPLPGDAPGGRVGLPPCLPPRRASTTPSGRPTRSPEVGGEDAVRRRVATSGSTSSRASSRARCRCTRTATGPTRS